MVNREACETINFQLNVMFGMMGKMFPALTKEREDGSKEDTVMIEDL